MTVLDATYAVLLEAAEPLHYRVITSRILESGRWFPTGKTPEATVNSALGTDIRTRGLASRFRRARRGVYALAESVPVTTSNVESKKVTAPTEPAVQTTLTLLDAAEHVLRESASREPLSYIEITNRALTAGLIHTEGKTPAASLNAQVGVDIRRRQERGERPRFVRPGRGLIALAADLPTGLAASIDNQNREVRSNLLKEVHAGGWEGFELLVEDLLKTIGLIDVERTPSSQDRGVDVRGTVVVAGVMHIRLAVQTKCQTTNVQAPRIRELRGSLRPYERGLLVTTSDFSRGARKEAARSDVAPVALMNGEELAALLAANADEMTADLGVRREDLTLFTLDKPPASRPQF